MNFVRANVNYFKERYKGLQPLPEFSGEETWVDRLRTWEDFVDGGHLTADFLESFFKSCVKGKGEEKERRSMIGNFGNCA